jgi:hypothetical protein
VSAGLLGNFITSFLTKAYKVFKQWHQKLLGSWARTGTPTAKTTKESDFRFVLSTNTVVLLRQGLMR